MDKRTLIFFVSLTLTLFMVNLFFEMQQQENNKVWYEQQTIKKEQQQRELRANIVKRTQQVSELPVVDIYADIGGKNYLSSGIQADGNVLAISWERSVPTTVYVRPAKSAASLKRVTLVAQASQEGNPVLYHGSDATPLKIVDLPTFGTYDLPMVSVEPNEAGPHIHVTLGGYRDNALFLPAMDLELNEDDKHNFLPQTNAIALKRTPQGFFPVGIYSVDDHLLRLLDEYHNLGNVNLIKEDAPKVPEIAEQKFYVLEDTYQQLVFSNIGGALVEINLLFETEANPKSVVKEIEIDREMVEKHPHDAYFPGHSYFSGADTGKGPYPEHKQGKLGGYYPLIRRDLIGDNGQVTTAINPQYYACNIVSDYPEMASRPYEVTYFDSKKIVFESTVGRRKITRTYSINPELAPYCVEFTIDVEGDARGLWLTSGVPEVELISGSPAPSIKYRVTRNGKGEVVNVDPPNDTITFSSFSPDWLSDGNGFFGLIMDPVTEIDPGYKAMQVSGKSVPSRMVLLKPDGEADFPGYQVMLPLKNSGGQMKFRLYAGPYANDILKKVDAAYADPATGYNPEYTSSQSFHGWFSVISQPFADFLFILMKFFHSITDSWALSIILLTVVLRIFLYPLNAWSMKSSMAMQQLGPEIHAINERNKKDPKKGQIEIMNLYRDRGVNPISGCFPLLIQLPFLIAMFDLLRSTFELRGASAVPGWIDNLTSPDVLFSWTTPVIPFIGNQFHLLPIILGGFMFLQQRMMTPTPKDPSEMTDQQRQTRAMSTLMAPVFTILFYNFPSGLNIYWLSSTILGVAQQWLMQRRFKSKQVEVLKAEPTKAPAKKKKKG